MSDWKRMYRRVCRWPDDHDWKVKPVEDYVASDGDQNASRIYFGQQFTEEPVALGQ